MIPGIVFVTLILLYLFLILPRMRHRPDYSVLSGFYYAHRGLHDNATEAPENSLSAFRLAIQSGYGIELDVQLTKDKVPVVFHDDTLRRVCGRPGNIWDYTYEELQRFRLCESAQTIPTLQEVLQLVDGQVPLILEFKMHDTNPEVCAISDPLLQQYRGVYCIESFYPFAVRWFRIKHPEIIRGQLSAHFSTENKPESFPQWCVHMLLTNVFCRPDFISYCCADTGNLSRTICRNLFGALSVAWTIRSAQELEQYRNNYDLFIFEHFRP